MTAYIIRRLLLMIPTLLGIMTINFLIIQLAPGGPVEQAIAQLTGEGTTAKDLSSAGSNVPLTYNTGGGSDISFNLTGYSKSCQVKALTPACCRSPHSRSGSNRWRAATTSRAARRGKNKRCGG